MGLSIVQPENVWPIGISNFFVDPGGRVSYWRFQQYLSIRKLVTFGVCV